MFVPSTVALRYNPAKNKQPFLEQLNHGFTSAYLKVADQFFPEAGSLKVQNHLVKAVAKAGTVELGTTEITVTNSQNTIVTTIPLADIRQFSLIPLKEAVISNASFVSFSESYYTCGLTIVSKEQILYVNIATFNVLPTLQTYTNQHQIILEDYFGLLQREPDTIGDYLKSQYSTVAANFWPLN